MTDTKQLLIVHVLFKEGERTIEGVVPGGIKTSNEGSLILMTALDENGQMIAYYPSKVSPMSEEITGKL